MMKQFFITLIFVGTFVSLHAAKPSDVQPCDSLQARCDSLQLRCDELQNRLTKLENEASRYVQPLITLSNDTTPLDAFDVKKAQDAIDLYSKGREIVTLINPAPDFNADATIPYLQFIIETATTVQQGKKLLSDTYTAAQSSKLSDELNGLSYNSKLNDEQRILCRTVAQAIVNDALLREYLVKFLTSFLETACIPDADVASEAYQNFKKEFLSTYLGDRDNVPEKYVLLHSTINEFTRTMNNYKGTLRDENRFRSWVQNFIDKLTVKP